MSLENGGLFDFKDNWIPSHWAHRLGKNADIGYSGIDGNDNCIDPLDLTDLFNIITSRCSRRPIEEDERVHYHIFE